MSKPDPDSAIRPFRRWPSSVAPSGLPPAAVVCLETVLDPPPSDKLRRRAVKALEIHAKLAPERLPRASNTVRLIDQEKKKWHGQRSDRTLISDEPLAVKMLQWSREKRESFVAALSAYQVHSFAIEGVEISEDGIRSETAARIPS